MVRHSISSMFLSTEIYTLLHYLRNTLCHPKFLFHSDDCSEQTEYYSKFKHLFWTQGSQIKHGERKTPYLLLKTMKKNWPGLDSSLDFSTEPIKFIKWVHMSYCSFKLYHFIMCDPIKDLIVLLQPLVEHRHMPYD